MTTDKELLELAARVAGIEYRSDSGYRVTGIGETGMPLLKKWNPLTDDGDALRLAVKLGIALDRASNRCWTFAAGMAVEGVCEEFYKDDKYAATRRAIVRAAAEIGRGMG